MQTIRRTAELRELLAALRAGGGRVALVPTMGALHAGHLSLVAEARRRAEHVVASIFVNPLQFGAGEDLDRYPRRERADAALLSEVGVAVLWAPAADDMYPDGFASTVSVSGITDGFEGATRPGHFDGVATVVAKLFGQVRPDVALFGEKDWQQLQLIRRMATDLDLGVEVVGVPTMRDADGLALSSRNAYLTPEARTAARAMPRALGEAAAALGRGTAADDALAAGRAALERAGFEVDYLALIDGASMRPIDAVVDGARLIAAARIDGTRLIDNLAV
ncbi:pantoate--beta-alanine ligase [Sphingomonas jejuensis]|uniref:Pantothenate synthetase n=1 Tax=Sphingomonas jejuensis TaxID=904715 RepID=A0ABX0XNI9_9SPHN|nr:pantoate--beta-alanine ligase [Sphingomonas jejuensis]